LVADIRLTANAPFGRGESRAKTKLIQDAPAENARTGHIPSGSIVESLDSPDAIEGRQRERLLPLLEWRPHHLLPSLQAGVDHTGAVKCLPNSCRDGRTDRAGLF